MALVVGAVTNKMAPTEPSTAKTIATLLMEDHDGWGRMRDGVSRARDFPGPVPSLFPASIYYPNGAVIVHDSNFEPG